MVKRVRVRHGLMSSILPDDTEFAPEDLFRTYFNPII